MVVLVGVTDTEAEGPTVTVVTAELVQVPLLPITVYVVLTVGVAVTLDPEEELKEEDGVQV